MLSPMIFPNKWNSAGDNGEKLMILTITCEKQLCIANHFLRAALLKEKQKDLLIMSDVLSCLKIKRCSLLIGSKDICQQSVPFYLYPNNIIKKNFSKNIVRCQRKRPVKYPLHISFRFQIRGNHGVDKNIEEVELIFSPLHR